MKRQQLIDARARASGKGNTASAISTLLEVCVNPRAPANARISAAQEILNRSSIGPIISRTANANLNVGTGIEALLKKLDAAKEQGLVIDVAGSNFD